jgi:hypothetical protein
MMPIDETLAVAPTVITLELAITINAYRKDRVEQVRCTRLSVPASGIAWKVRVR